MKNTIKLGLLFFLAMTVIITWSVYGYNKYKVNDITAEYTAITYSLPDGDRTGEEKISFTGEMEHSEKDFDRLDGTIILRGKTFNISKSPLDPAQYFYLTDSDGSYFGTLVLEPKRKTDLFGKSWYLLPEIDKFTILIGGSELTSSFSECYEAVVYDPQGDDETNREKIANLMSCVFCDKKY